MSEMLANSYFISRDFGKALPYFEEALLKGNASDKIKKKLIICYIVVGRIDDAFNLFFSVVNRDPMIIINTDPYWDDCPCPEMVRKWESNRDVNVESPETSLILGMLYLFCDVQKSISYLEKALELDNYYLKLSSVLRKLKQVANSY